MKFYNIKFTLEMDGKTLRNERNNEIVNEFTTSLHETEQECLNEAHDYCMLFCKSFKKNSGVEAQYNWVDVKEVK